MLQTRDELDAKEALCDLIHEATERGDTTFNISNNFVLKRIPEDIKRIKTLQILHVDNCFELRSLPAAIGDLKQLRWLNLSYNKLTTLPPEIGKLVNLERLHVGNNHLAALPMELWSLKKLEELRCESNQLLALPSGLLMLPALRELLIENNTFVSQADVDERDPYELFPPVSSADCCSCRIHFHHRPLTMVTFHPVLNAEPLPFVHYVCSERCLSQLQIRLEAAAEGRIPGSPNLSPKRVQNQNLNSIAAAPVAADEAQ